MTIKQFNEALRDIRNGDTFDLFFDEYYPQIIKISLYLYHDEQDAQDIAQEIFKYLLTHKVNTYVDNPRAWLCALCKYNGVKLCKKELPLNEDLEIETPLTQYLSLEMRLALNNLSQEEKDIVLLIWFYGYSLMEVATILHKSYLAVAKQHERIKKKLKNILSK